MAKIESEKKIEKFLKDKVENDFNGLCFKMLSIHINGLPDRICLMPKGRIFFAETKTTKEKATKRQLLIHKSLTKLGFRVEIIESTDQVKKILMDYL